MYNLFISVIIPVYMVSDYLERCINSVVSQSYLNCEIILVDDGSFDDCAQICDEWAQKDKRIMVIHKANGGLSDARNYGMELASGEYFSFIDSDDYITDDFLETLISTALKHDSDIVECNCTNCYENGEYEAYHDDSAVIDFSTSEGLSALIEEKLLHQHVWDKIYKREAVQSVSFVVGKQHEDVFWTYQIFGQAERITKINRTMYFYFQRESSIMGQGYNLRRLDALEGKWNRQLFLEKRFPELSSQAKLDFFGSCIYMLQGILKNMSGNEKKQAVLRIKAYKKMCRLSIKEIQTLNGAIRKYYYLAKINIYLCCKLRISFGIE